MAAVLFAALTGAGFGAFAVAVRWGLQRGADPHVGAFVASSIAVLLCGLAAVPSAVERSVDPGELWPFFVAGLIVPGLSQISFNLAVRHAGPSRASILVGTAPLLSVLIALALLDEPVRPAMIVGTVLVVLGGAALTRERSRPVDFRLLGAGFALLCAALFAARDNVVRWAAREEHPPPLVAATASLLAAALILFLSLLVFRRAHLRAQLRRTAPAFAGAGLTLALAYGLLVVAFDRGRVSVVAPLNATQSLWAVVFSAVVIGRSEMIGRHTVLAGLLVVGGGALIGAFR